ncbi:MAG: sensor histidine kinase, partial [Phormidesmis sp. RL_2_1]|nr:sensor histidine kinase [Phormidesmis sp. RL_2_1]
MTSLNRLKDPSLRFLLWLEWILLGVSALGEIRQQLQLFEVRSPLISLACIALLGLLGLRLPQTSLSAKLAYMAINLCLVMTASVVGHIQFFFLLCVVLMLRSCLIFNRQGRWLTMTAMFVVFVAVQNYRIQTFNGRFLANRFSQDPDTLTRPFLTGAIVLFSLVLIFLQMMINALLAERHSRQQLSLANEQLRRYALQVEEIATLQERTRIAREIHDALGHSLTALNLNLSAAIGLWENEDLNEAKSLLNTAQGLSQSALNDVRQAITTLRADSLKGRPLGDLIQGLVVKLQHTTGLQPQTVVQIDTALNEPKNSHVSHCARSADKYYQ